MQDTENAVPTTSKRLLWNITITTMTATKRTAAACALCRLTRAAKEDVRELRQIADAGFSRPS
jgi:hypothetical protein